MAIKGYDPNRAYLLGLLNNEENNQLEKVARVFDSSFRLVEEYKTFPEAKVGDAALRRDFNYDGSSVIGEKVSVVEWTQALEDLANPQPAPITDIVLSDQQVNDGDPPGTKVADIFATGGTDPITFTKTSDPSNKFSISGNELFLTDTANIADGSYFVGIQATDANSQTFTKGFTITVDPASAFVNNLSTNFPGATFGVIGQPANLDFDPAADDFAISFWVKTTESSVQELVSKRNNNQNLSQFEISMNASGQVQARLGDGDVITTTGTINAGAWHHVVLEADQATGFKNVYIDGAFETSGLLGSTTNAFDILVGARRTSGNTGSADIFQGNIDELAFYSNKLGGAGVFEIYNGGEPNNLLTNSSGSDLVSWFRMGDGDFLPNINDVVNSNVIAMSGSPTFQADVPSAGSGFSNTTSTFFDGINQRVQIGTPDDINFSNDDPFTISAWVKRDSISGNDAILGNVTGANNEGYTLYFDNNGANRLNFNLSNSNANQIRTRVTLGGGFTGNWFHVAITYDGSSNANGITYYINGAAVVDQILENGLNQPISSSQPMTFGSRSAGADSFVGNLDEIAFYGAELTAGQVADIYNSGSPNDLLQLSSAGNILHWYRMGDGDTFPIIQDNTGSFDGLMINMSSLNFEADTP